MVEPQETSIFGQLLKQRALLNGTMMKKGAKLMPKEIIANEKKRIVAFKSLKAELI